MRCYFHLVNDQEHLVDQDGIAVTGLAMAFSEDLRVIEDVRQEDLTLNADWSGWGHVTST
ncbi:hypothetical protein [Microvirga arsenatis]|uniref:Uncharacterized protein n=1 Tax=Microvirga arsenatis TaxID=2692265 RepID=A0ABW9Z459_9HYPH|nr:hypothetical protein [Microvirga arsenatis]NBJ13882.1 hypothetical protein [Microvirga arsenatis]NBJ27337.1 hypothetical protein [Microvirga arsenatis]